MIRLLIRITACFLLLTGTFQRTATAGLENDDWHEIRSENFQIFTNAKPRRVKPLAEDLEYFRSAALLLLSKDPADSYIPFKIFVLESRNDFKDIYPEDWVIGAFNASMRGHFALVDLSNRTFDHRGRRIKGAPSILKHEYVHFLLRQRSTVDYPFWYEEGFAEYLSTLEYDDKVIRLGFPVADRHFSLAGENFGSLESLLVSTRSDAKLDMNRLYAQSWLLVHHLNTEPALSGKVIEYLTAYNETGTSLATFREVFDLDLDDLRRELERKWKKGKYQYRNLELREPLPAPTVTSRPLSKIEGLTELAGVMQIFDEGDPNDEIAKLYTEILTIDPDHPTALARMAEIEMKAGRMEAAHVLLSQAGKETPSAPLQIMWGDYLLTRAVAEAPRHGLIPAETLMEIRQHYLQALRADPHSPEAFYSFGLSYLGSGEDTLDQGVLAFEEAHYLLPTKRWLIDKTIMMHLQAGNRQEAEALIADSKTWHRGKGFREFRKLVERLARNGNEEQAREVAYIYLRGLLK